MLGRLLGTLDFVQIGEVTTQGVAEFSNRIAQSLDELAGAIENIYFPRIPIA